MFKVQGKGAFKLSNPLHHVPWACEATLRPKPSQSQARRMERRDLLELFVLETGNLLKPKP